MKPIFLSYSRKDADAVRRIAKILMSVGIRTWQDISSLGAGITADQIEKALGEQCAGLLLYVTKNSMDSAFIRDIELREANQRCIQDPTFSIVPLFDAPLEEANKAFIGTLRGGLSRYNGAIVGRGISLEEAALRARRILLKSILPLNEERDLSVALSTYQRTDAQLPVFLDLDWSRAFDPGELMVQKSWDEQVKSVLTDLKDGLLEQGKTRICLYPKAHLTTAFATGFVFRSVTGFDVQVKQGDQWWSTKSKGSVPDGLDVRQESGSLNSRELAVNLSITWDVDQKVGEFMKKSGKEFRSILYCRPMSGPSNEAILNAESASAVAKRISTEIRSSLMKNNVSDIHIFASTPYGLSFLIGTELNACGHIHLYEYDKSEGYFPSWIIDAND